MTLISKLKDLLGLGSDRRGDRGTVVTVEREPDAETERAVKETPPPREEPATPTSTAEPAEGPADEPVQSVKGIGPAYGERLAGAGVHTVGDLTAADPAELADATGIGEGRIAGWMESAERSASPETDSAESSR